MRKVQAQPGVQLMVLAGEQSRQIVGGAIVDLDEVVVPAREDRPAETLADLLGPHVALFASAVVAPPEIPFTTGLPLDHPSAAPASEE